MVSQSNTSVNVALCLTAMLIATPTTHAQLSTLPKRYRRPTQKLESSGGFGSQRRQIVGQQQPQQQQQQQREKTNLRKKESKNLHDDKESKNLHDDRHLLSNDLSIPPLLTFEIDMPIKPTTPEALRVSEMSMPTGQSEMSLSMSMPLMDESWDMSMPFVEQPPTEGTDELVSLDNGSGSGNTVVLASFLAGLSALVVGAVALFVKMRQVHGREADETQERENSVAKEVSFTTQDELNVLADECHDIILSPLKTRVVSSSSQGHDVIIS